MLEIGRPSDLFELEFEPDRCRGFGSVSNSDQLEGRLFKTVQDCSRLIPSIFEERSKRLLPVEMLRISKESRIAIVGGGAWGLSTALHLHQAGYNNVTVFERSEIIPSPYSAANDLNKIVRAEYEVQMIFRTASAFAD